MKKIVFVLLISVMMGSMAFAKEEPSSIKVLSKKRHVLYFKCSGDMIGATIEVENEEHQSIATDQVADTKTIVDFFFLPPGEYTVKVKKGEVEVNIEYINR